MLNANVEYTISEAADIIGYAPHVLRFYEKEFDINIPRKDSNHRYYTYKEIELLHYIKDLKDKGFGNKQIKLIINSPETILSKDMATSNEMVKQGNLPLDIDQFSLAISESLGDSFVQKIADYLEKEEKDTNLLINNLKDEIIELRNEIKSKERDILISENAKLKMKVKEKTYENVKIKEELTRLSSSKKGLFSKIFNIGNLG